ncbi:MAG: MFS transporter [Candidatus Dormibacteria bacterium]
MSRGLVLLLAVACGAAVANMYYAQPLLHMIARVFAVSSGTAGLLVTVTQLGYVAGLALLVPLGDLLQRRRLITSAVVVTAAALALAAFAPSFAVFAVAVAVVGVTSVVAQIIVPWASSLAAEDERSRVVGTVMSGLLVGILVARTLGGLVAGIAGWRAVFVMASAGMLVLAVVLRRALPVGEPNEKMPYPALLASVTDLVREEPVLRLRMGLGAAAMGCFSILWTAITFLLSGAPYHYGPATIGMFGLAGLAGALVAPLAGRLADHGHGRLATIGAIVVLLTSWGLLDLGATSLVALIAGIVVLDLGAQALHISNQSAIYALRPPQARSRLTTAYMVAYFLGGATGSAGASALYSTSGWSGVCALGAGTATLALGLWFASQRVASSDHLPQRP